MKKVVFTVAMIVLPLIVLGAVELVLRLSGVGEDGRDAFIPIPGKETHQALNPAYVTRYFQGFAPAIAFHPFEVEKSPQTFRVFVLGGSSTAGYPYHFYHSFSEGLRGQLQRAAPERVIEVVNLGMSAVNSYTLWDLRHAIVDAKPDAVVIYAGHNEYYGAFGVGSNVYRLGGQGWVKRLVLRLKHSALYTALERFGRPSEAAAPRQTMMARVVGDAAIAYQQDAFNEGVEQFEHNVRAVLTTFAEARVPVFMGLLASNLKDQAPLGTEPEAQAAYEAGLAAFEADNLADAEAAFLEAKEQDGLRFRAPEAMNNILRTFAASSLGTLVDMPSLAKLQSASGIGDDTFFDDHLHPNAAGHAAMAQAFYRAMRDQWEWMLEEGHSVGTENLDPAEDTYAALQIAVLEAGYPFNKTRTPAEVERITRQLLQRTTRQSFYDSLAVMMATQQKPPPAALLEGLRYAKAQQDTVRALQFYRSLLHWQPFNTRLLEEAVSYAVASTQYDRWGEPIIAYAWARTHALDYLHAWAAVKLRQQDLDAAEHLLTTAEDLDPNAPVMLFNKARLLVMKGDTSAARTYFQRYQQAQQ